jgi:hypothetical protein
MSCILLFWNSIIGSIGSTVIPILPIIEGSLIRITGSDYAVDSRLIFRDSVSQTKLKMRYYLVSKYPLCLNEFETLYQALKAQQNVRIYNLLPHKKPSSMYVYTTYCNTKSPAVCTYIQPTVTPKAQQYVRIYNLL